MWFTDSHQWKHTWICASVNNDEMFSEYNDVALRHNRSNCLFYLKVKVQWKLKWSFLLLKKLIGEKCVISHLLIFSLHPRIQQNSLAPQNVKNCIKKWQITTKIAHLAPCLVCLPAPQDVLPDLPKEEEGNTFIYTSASFCLCHLRYSVNKNTFPSLVGP